MKTGQGAKAFLRKQMFAQRKAAFADKAAKDPEANARLLAHFGDVAGKVIAGYRPIRTEIDPTEAMAALYAAGARIGVPVIEGEARPLLFHEWAPGCEMVEGAFGAEVPASAIPVRPDILIVPLVGWDRRGWRLGYGGGFYDRTLEQLREHAPVHAVGFAYAAQEMAEAPREPTDQRLDALVSENETINFEPAA